MSTPILCPFEVPPTNVQDNYLTWTSFSLFKEQLVWGVDTSGRGEGDGERHGRVNTEQILCSHVYKWKMIPVETIQEIVGRRLQENDGVGAFKFDIFDIL
jgi:hypothetical protein